YESAAHVTIDTASLSKAEVVDEVLARFAETAERVQ
ncbi:MAG: hypothetical protein QOH10_1604, partial [Actinomycetota bacterium]|nr:hypothetical protein [Actinomycetota bacterium]